MHGKFKKPSSDLMGLAHDENHIITEWIGPGRIVFSMSRMGDSLSCHFASDKHGLRYIKEAIEDFVRMVMERFQWCKMLVAAVNKSSVERLIVKCGFVYECNFNGATIYKRHLWEA